MMNHLFVDEVPLHKHLTVYLSHDGKWLCHTTEICKKATRRLVILRRYSQKLSRKTMKMIYNAYIRPIIEYSNQVYTNLTLAYAEKLEELNRCGLRCVTGCKVGTSHQELYRETDELSLEERRMKSRMNKLYEVLKEDRSCRLNRGMIQTVGERNPHARHRANDLTQLKATTEQMCQSFLPHSIREWMNWKMKSRINLQPSTIAIFKGITKHKPKPNRVYNLEYTRASAIEMTRLRCENGNLKENLHSRLLALSPLCECGEIETTTTTSSPALYTITADKQRWTVCPARTGSYKISTMAMIQNG